MVYANRSEVLTGIAGALAYRDGTVSVANADALRGTVIDELVWSAVFGTDDVKPLCKELVWKAAQELGVLPSSILQLYTAIGAGQVSGFSVPAINIRLLNYDFSRAIFRAANRLNAGAIILEIARSEMGYTQQPQDEFVTCVLGAAIKEKYDMPVFIQGDHFQVNAKKYKENPQKELDGVLDLIRKSVAAGFYNIDLDTSTLVDESRPTMDEQQKDNYTVAVEMTKYIRSIQPKGVEVSCGGEIGEIGKHNSNEQELVAYMEGYNRLLPRGMHGISKMAIQTGTSHGGTVTADGTLAAVKLDFATIEKLTKIAREKYKLAGCVQHGASTLPVDMFDKFPAVHTLEVHLATDFQNIVFDHPKFPADLKKEMYAWCDANCADERKATDTDQQFHYKTRKKANGPFKKQIWNLPADVKAAVIGDLEKRVQTIFEKLNIRGTKDVVRRFVTPVKVAMAATAPAARAEHFDGAD